MADWITKQSIIQAILTIVGVWAMLRGEAEQAVTMFTGSLIIAALKD